MAGRWETISGDCVFLLLAHSRAPQWCIAAPSLVFNQLGGISRLLQRRASPGSGRAFVRLLSPLRDRFICQSPQARKASARIADLPYLGRSRSILADCVDWCTLYILLRLA